jgi:SIR2-like domain
MEPGRRTPGAKQRALARQGTIDVSPLISDGLTQLSFSLFENRGVFAILLGSGLSRAAEIPTGWEITLDLIRRVAIAQGVEEQPDWAEWYRQRIGQEPNYSALLEELARSPSERRAILNRYIEPTKEDREDGRKIPTAAHHAIAELVRGGYIRVLVTTNFDRLTESALREVGVEPTVVASVDALKGAEPMAHSTCYILKLHGDYKDTRILNTDAELSAYPPDFDRQLDRVFDEYGLIVCGWSGEWDHALREAILRAPNRRYPMYWVARGELGNGAPKALVSHRRAQVLSAKDADSFFKNLLSRVEALEQTQRQNPLSIELLVKSTRRYLTKSEHRIQLNELCTQEVDRVLEGLGATDFDPTGPLSQEALRARIRKYESVTEPLARIVGTLGRWGDGSELSMVLDIISNLYRHAEKAAGGRILYLNLRFYPAVLVFTCYGLGLKRSERWSNLHHLLSATISREGKAPSRLVDELFLFAWEGGKNDIWQQVNGLEKRKTPLSDHLYALLADWGKSFLDLVPDFELMFEGFEVLGSLVHFEQHSATEVTTTLSKDRDNYSYMPVGRAVWHEVNRHKLISRMQSEPLKGDLVKAGFAQRNPAFLKLFCDNFERMARTVR